MKRLVMACVAIGISAGTAGAQQAPPAGPQQPVTFSGGMKRSWDNVKRNVAEAAEKMPEAEYGFKPSPDVRTFGEMVLHIAASQFGTCSRAKGETPPQPGAAAAKLTTKADIVKELQASIAVCDAVFASLTTDEALIKPITVGTGQAIPANMLWGNTSHSNEHYGNLVTYMRIKGIVPPSTERNQKPRPSGAN